MRSERLFLFAALAGAATFAAALYFQYFQDLPPCKLCIWQRYALGVGIGGALLAAAIPSARVLLGLIGFAGYAAESAIAIYHTGVEQKWWLGPQTCSGGNVSDTFQGFGQQIKNVVQCDEIVWTFMGLSMANWNVLIAAALAVLCAVAALRGSYSSSSASQ